MTGVFSKLSVAKLTAMELATINRLLPAEILGRVLGLLSHGDLRSAVLVCRWWREVGE